MGKLKDAEVERPASDFPKHTLTSAVRVPKVIEEMNGGRPLPPAEVAIGLGLSPGSSDFRVLLSASVKYGLSVGSYKSERIAITDLGSRVAAPASESEGKQALLAAAMSPPTFRKLYEHFKGKKLPEDTFFQNAIVREFSVPREHAAKCARVFRENADAVGLVREASTGAWLVPQPVEFDGPNPSVAVDGEEEPILSVSAERQPAIADVTQDRDEAQSHPPAPHKALRVFISHSKNMEIVGQIKTMLNAVEVPFEIAVEQETTAIPVPDKVFSAMRNCSAAVICVTADQASADPSTVNQNVLIEIGAAFVLYDKRVILVWDKRIPVPSNLQGLYRCEFEGNELSWSRGMKLMEAIKQFRSSAAPA